MDSIEKVMEIISAESEKIIKITFSGILDKSNTFKKITVEKKSADNFQAAEFFERKVRHKNLKTKKELLSFVRDRLILGYKQSDIICTDRDIKILTNKKRQYKIICSKPKKNDFKETTHNREKNYIIKENQKIDWLIELGIMTKDFKIAKDKTKKFRQINKFLEIVSGFDIPDNAFAVDFGCGKSYLTFALYYYFNIINKKNISILGLDLKDDVVKYCNNLSKKFGFKNLSFAQGDIKDYKKDRPIDMVVTLHACDTATDYALYNAIRWDTKIVLSVPCCQHELNGQIKNEQLAPILRYGILKERFSAILTDAIRAEILKLCGYKTDIVEFAGLSDTSKNLMLRAVKTNSKKTGSEDELIRLMSEFSLKPTLYLLLQEERGFTGL